MSPNIIDWLRVNYGQPPAAYFFIIAISGIVSTVYILAQTKLVDRRKIKLYSERVKKWQEKRKKAMASGSRRLMMEVQKETELITKMQNEITKEQSKPMLIFFIPFLLIFWFIQLIYGPNVLARLPFNLPLVGANLTAVWFYIFSNIIFSSILNTLLKLYDEIKSI